MAHIPRSSRAVDEEEPTRFSPVPLQLEPDSLHLQRLDARAAVDVARRRHTAARLALVTRSPDAAPRPDPALAAADDAAARLRAAVGVLTSLDVLHGIDVSATVDVDVEVDGALTVVRPRGELDLFTSPRLEQASVGLLDAAPVGRMVVDLSAVTFLDSSGLAVLVEIRRVCLESGTTFALTGLGTRAHRLLAITRLDAVFEIV